jgi:hypothetical protein
MGESLSPNTMIWTTKLALLTVGLLAVGGAAAATTNPTALAHMAENAKGALTGHRDASAECGEWRNHGEYVSSVANATHDGSADDLSTVPHDDLSTVPHDDLEDETGDEHQNRSDMRNMTREQRKDARENETDARENDTDDTETDDAENSAVRDAARSDIGKGCQRAEHEQVRDDPPADQPVDESDDAETVTRGKSAEHRHQKG